MLTEQEIKEADCIIVAADAKVPMTRFNGKKVIECPVSDGISKADTLIDRAIKGTFPYTMRGKKSRIQKMKQKAGLHIRFIHS